MHVHTTDPLKILEKKQLHGSTAVDPAGAKKQNAKALDDGIRKVKERNFWDNHTNSTFETKSMAKINGKHGDLM